MPKIAYEQKRFSAETLRTIEQAEAIIVSYQHQGFSLTLRQLYYQFVARGLIPNTEKSYTRIGNVVSDARRAGLIDWNAIEDRTRFMRDLPCWENPSEIIATAEHNYHRDLWANQARRIEVWIEKDALVGVIEGVCNEFDVPFLSCRGYVSDSEMWHQAMRLLGHREKGQGTLILHLGDHDPSGIDMTRDIADRLRLFTMDPNYINIKRVALTMAQIDELRPPPNPAKLTDTRSQGYIARYGNQSWELDALEPSYINDLLRREILAIRDAGSWEDICQKQEAERGQIGQLAKLLNTTVPLVTVTVTDSQCQCCGVDLTDKRGGARYCSDRCKQAGYRRRKVKA
jgi:hypothetical protein